MPVQFSDISETLNELPEIWGGLVKRIIAAKGHDGVQLDAKSDIQNCELLLREIDEKFISSVALADAIKSVDFDGPLPSVFLSELDDCADVLSERVRQLETDFNTIDSNGGIGGVNANDWVVTSSENGVNIDVGNHLSEILDAIEDFLIKYYKIGPIVIDSGYEVFSGAVAELSKILESARVQSTKIDDLQNSVEQLKAKTEASEQAAYQANESISEIKSQTESFEVDIAENHKESQSKLDRVKEIEQEAETLKEAVDQYETAFLKFEEQLDDRNERYETSLDKSEAILSLHEEHNIKIDEQIDEAGKLLGGATNVALAAAFEGTVTELDAKIDKAKISFNLSIVFLALSVLPFIGFVLFDPTNINYEIAVGFLFLIAAPGWLAKVNGGRYQNLFVLREHYKHKYVLAMSVPGFKEQVVDDEAKKGIAGWVFELVSFNPAENLSDTGDDQHPAPLMNWVLEKLKNDKK